jgi:cytochrome c553
MPGCREILLESCKSNPLEVFCGPTASKADFNATLEETCGRCHGREARSTGEAVIFDFVGDVDRLIENGYIERCSSQESAIIERLRPGGTPEHSRQSTGLDTWTVWSLAKYVDEQCGLVSVTCAGQPSTPGCGAFQAEATLEENCGSCHANPSTASCGTCDGLKYIDNLPRLIEAEKVVPCDWERSALARRIADGSMPPASSSVPPPRPRDVETLRSFVDGMCSELAESEGLAVERAEAQAQLAQSCGACHGDPLDIDEPAGGLDSIDDIEALIDQGQIVPCMSGRSPIIQRLRDGSMPPPAAIGSRPSPDDIDALARFIDRPCMWPDWP